MRAVLAAAVAALVTAGPVGAVAVPRIGPAAVPITAAQERPAGDKGRSCQAGNRRKVILKSRHPQVVACEQPPRSNLTSPDTLAKATAAALASFG